MRIIKTENYEREGNDCMIYNTISLYEHSGEYFLQIDERVTGWAEDKSSRTYTLDEKDWSIQKKIDMILENRFYGYIEFNVPDAI